MMHRLKCSFAAQLLQLCLPQASKQASEHERDKKRVMEVGKRKANHESIIIKPAAVGRRGAARSDGGDGSELNCN